VAGDFSLSNWVREEWVGSAALVHARPMPVDGLRRISVIRVTTPAIVLGSAQRLDLSQADVSFEQVRRRSGGGAVWVDEATGWVDVFIPRTDSLWVDDIGVSFAWLGDAAAEWLVRLGVDRERIRVVRPPFEPGKLGATLCFAGRGAGEVLVDERKMIGVSQRRTRSGARWQCCWYDLWRPEPLAGALGIAASRVAGAGIGVGELGEGILVGQRATVLADDFAATVSAIR
jgi:lipoate-protein ligase A